MAVQPVVKSKMATRSSSSNLLSLMELDKTFQQSIVKSRPSTHVKNYRLNVEASLEKKLDGCVSDHLSYEMKPGKNVVAKISSTAFEKAKMYILQTIRSQKFAEKYAYIEESEVDLNNAQVEYRLRFYNRKKDGGTGCQQIFVANFYNIKSSLLVNGSRVDVFCEEIPQPIEDYTRLNCELLNHINKSISAIIQSTKIKPNQKQSLQPSTVVCAPHVSDIPDQSDSITKHSAMGNESISRDESVERLYFCPICDSLSDMGTIACEQCDEWFHLNCVGLIKKLVKLGSAYHMFVTLAGINCSMINSPNINAHVDQDILTQESESRQQPFRQ